MGTIQLKVLWLLFALLVTGVCRAEIVRDLHAATVPVENQSAASLDKAAREALSDVLVKVSGSSGMLKNPVIVAALAKPRSHLQQYAYVKDQSDEGGMSARFEFEPDYITDLLVKAGAPLWTANRPLVLAWVVVEDGNGRHFITPDTEPDQARELLEAFARRGVPVQLPLFDLTDTAAVSVEDAWRLDGGAIQSASERYQVQDVIVGRLARLDEGSASGEWAYFHQGERTNRAVTAPDLQTFAREGANIVAGQMASRYAIAPSQGGASGVTMAVTGVNSYADYAAIVSWLEGLELVDYANIEQVQGDRITLRLQAKADAAQLATIIELNTHLLPAPMPVPGSAPGAVAATQLSYQWQN